MDECEMELSPAGACCACATLAGFLWDPAPRESPPSFGSWPFLSFERQVHGTRCA